MRVSVFGLGYVGCVSAACLAWKGHAVIGVDVNPQKVDFVNRGLSPVIEPQLDDILRAVTARDDGEAGTLRATVDGARAVLETDISLICVGTPSNHNGSLNDDYLRQCAREIGRAIAHKGGGHVVVVRSTTLPGTTQDVVVAELERASGLHAGRDFGVAVNPEFLREGSSVKDFHEPPMTIIGELDARSGDAVAALYEFLEAPATRMKIREAEMVKYACNAFHAVKVCFANEIGTMCKAMQIDSHAVMDAFCQDEKLNLSSYYLKPGFAFGGSCLPKDLRALQQRARALDADLPMLQSVLTSNRVHLERAIDQVLRWGKMRVGILGLSFKAGTDDIRESPSVTLVETLIGKGFDVKIFDRNVSLSRLVGANRKYILSEIPQIASLMCDDVQSVIEHAEVIVIANHAPDFAEVIHSLDGSVRVLDLVRICDDPQQVPRGYEGICW